MTRYRVRLYGLVKDHSCLQITGPGVVNFRVVVMGVTSHGTFVLMRQSGENGLNAAMSWLKNIASRGADARLTKKQSIARSAKPMPKGEVIVFDGSVMVDTRGAHVALTESIEEIRASIARSNAAAAAAEESRAKANMASVLLAPSPDAITGDFASTSTGRAGKKDGRASAATSGALQKLRTRKQKRGSAESGGSDKP